MADQKAGYIGFAGYRIQVVTDCYENEEKENLQLYLGLGSGEIFEYGRIQVKVLI